MAIGFMFFIFGIYAISDERISTGVLYLFCMSSIFSLQTEPEKAFTDLTKIDWLSNPKKTRPTYGP
jgi:hypothetical protein